MSPIMTPIQNQYSLQVPAHRFLQGGRDVYYFALDLATLDGLLPERVDESIIKDANRRLTPSHAQNIQFYLNETEDWLLGALMLGIAPDAVEFEPFQPADGEVYNPSFGELRIRTNRKNTMKIFDGQHRRRAIGDILTELSNANGDLSTQKLASLREASMTIVLYAEEHTKTLKQMFVDASKTKRIESHTVTRFDLRDAFSITAVRVANGSRLLNGRVEMEASSVAAASQNLVAVNQLETVLKSLEVGYQGRVSRDINSINMLDLDGLYERCLVWTDKFMPAAREEYLGLLTGDIENSEIPQLRTKTFAYNVTFIRVLAGCYHLWVDEHGADSWEPLAEFVRKSLIDRAPDYGLLADANLVYPSGRELFARRQEVKRAIKYIVNVAKAAS